MIRMRTGEKLVPHQFANDWISVSRPDGSPAGIVSPREVMLDPEDFAFFREQQHVGSFWVEWELLGDGRFRRRPRVARRGATEPSGDAALFD